MNAIAIINGPNLNLLGTRETDIYGNQKFEDFFLTLKTEFKDIELDYFQSNIEGELINAIQQFSQKGFSIVLNPAGYSHTSVAIADAIAAVNAVVVEVHISNIYARESYRHISITGSKAIGVISGLGLHGYKMAIAYLQNYKS